MKDLPFFIHFNELKYRSFFFLLSLFLCISVSFTDPICVLFILIKPLWVHIQGPLLFTHPLEGIHASLGAQGILSFLFSWPLFIYHFWSFMSPSLYKYEKKVLSFLLSTFLFLFVFGFSFFYIGLLPMFCKFLLTYSSWFAVLEPRVLDYVLFFVRFFLSLLFFFFIPFLIFFVCLQMGKDPKFLEGLRPWSILFCLLLGALLSPPEISTQLIIGFGFYIWYEILILGLWIYWIKTKIGFRDPKLLTKE
uniref:SecY-independent transporter protein n=1 Tax=Chloropicon primus TaxID=1764295 RepID=A0A4D6C439_9CHLO|nr:SecY-independent transporter protein [Chloropicon primus]QBX98451.1 SecY-independent transporter protein [Chloropicon primus]